MSIFTKKLKGRPKPTFNQNSMDNYTNELNEIIDKLSVINRDILGIYEAITKEANIQIEKISLISNDDANFVYSIKDLDKKFTELINNYMEGLSGYYTFINKFSTTLSIDTYDNNNNVQLLKITINRLIYDIKKIIPAEKYNINNPFNSIKNIPENLESALNDYGTVFEEKKTNYISNLIQKYINLIKTFNKDKNNINRLNAYKNNNKIKFNDGIIDNIQRLRNKFNKILINKKSILNIKANLELNNYNLSTFSTYNNNLQIKFNSTIDELINKFEYIIDKLMGIKSQILSNFKSQSTSIEPLQTSNEGFIGKFKENENVKYRNLNGKIHNVQFAKYLDTNRANIYTNEDKSKTKTVLISQLSKINSPIEKVSELNNNPSVVISSKSVNGPVPTSSITNSSLNSIGSNVISSQNNQISSSNTLQTSNEGLVRNFKLNENVLYNNGTEKYHAKFNKYFGKNGAIIKYRNTNGKNKTPYVKISQLSKINSPIEKVSGLNNNSSVVISSKSVNLPLSTSRITNSSLNPIGSNVGVGVNQEGNTSEPIISSTESGSKSSNKLITNTGKGKEEKQQENSSPIASALSMQSNTKPDIKKGNKFKGLNKNGKNENYTYNVIDYANFKENMNNGKVQQNSFKPENISSVKNSNISFKSEKGNRYFVRRSNDKTTSRSINRLKKILNQTI